MEASEKPQLPLDQPRRARIRVRARATASSIEHLDDQRAGGRAGRPRAGRATPAASGRDGARKAIEIGARVIESEGTAANVDFVNSKFQEHMGGLAEQMGELLESGSQELAEQIASSFGADRSDSVQQQIREMLIKANEHQRTELVRLFNADDGANPLADFKTSVTAKVAEASQRSERQAEALRESQRASRRSSATRSPR